ncbi:MAG: hypothetical protein IPJ76_11880 [Flavobacteriales bacterium]|nr:MAG: hypothetical protein IPJ76_11880 [Flavobacteriales bacterium]
MNNSALDRPTFEAIEAYVLDRMSAEERGVFEQRMATDAGLRAEVELEQENIRAVELGGVERMLKSIATEEVTRDKNIAKGAWKQYLKYAAVVAIILSGSLWLLRPSANERLFAEHFAADPGLPVTMSATHDHAFQDAMVSYKEGKYSEARNKWGPLLQAEPINDTLRYYVASASLADGDAAAAVPLFEGLAEEPISAFSDKSRWFLFLAYVKTGEVAKAKAMSFDGDPAYAERVRAIKAELH